MDPIRRLIPSNGPVPESGLERDSGLVWSKKNSKIFQNLLCRNFDKFGSCPLSLHAFSYPIKSRNCPDPLLGNIVGHDIGAFLFICEANIITLILLDAEDLKIEGFEKNDGARENFNFSLKN